LNIYLMCYIFTNYPLDYPKKGYIRQEKVTVIENGIRLEDGKED